MIKRILNLLNAPFAETESPLMIVKNMAIGSVIVFLILFLFKPFDLRYLGDDLWWVCLGFGLITFAIGFIYEYTLHFILPITKQGKKWTLKFWILSTTGMILCISIGNYFYLIYLVEELSFYWLALLIMMVNTFIVAIIPTFISGLIVQNRNLSQNLEMAKRLEATIHSNPERSAEISIRSQEQNDNFNCQEDKLVYIEAMQNYISISHLNDDHVKKTMIRNSLKDTCTQICNSRVIRCHRSFIVNTSHVLHITGNAQGLQLKLTTGAIIPVSRSFIKTVRVAIEAI